MTSNLVRVLDAGHRERQALLNWWLEDPISDVSNKERVSFQKMMETVGYDSHNDCFIFSDGTTVTIEEANRRGRA